MLDKGGKSADMSNMNTFAKTVDMIHRALAANTVRRSVIANNIANSGVPNFKRSVVNFESELKRVLDTEKQNPAVMMTQTHPRHYSNYTERDYRDVQIRRVLDYTGTYNNNGNNVDPEQEFMNALENQMTYGLLASSIKFEFDQVNSVLKS
jgi:flagellar basal-body rod protein FlgB